MKRTGLRTYPDPCLRGKARRVEDFGPGVREMLEKMLEIMRLSDGIGLAAPQIGLGISLVVADAGSGAIRLVNPEIVHRAGETTPLQEGCLSLPGVTVTVRRSEKVTVRAQGADGAVFTREFEGLEAKVVQHEIDHLNGRLIIDHMAFLHKGIAAVRLILGTIRKSSRGRGCEVVCRGTDRTHRE